MSPIFGRIAFQLLLPVLAFLFIGVPLETYIRSLDGVFSTSESAAHIAREHLFFEAAACFYCITVLLEVIVILSRPHIRGRPNFPVSTINNIALFLAVLLVAAYVYIRLYNTGSHFDAQAATLFLVAMIIATTIIAIWVHVADYFSSSEVAPRPSSRTRTGSTR
jgi:drug/metabolite transporter (DMT)-like permease